MATELHVPNLFRNIAVYEAHVDQYWYVVTFKQREQNLDLLRFVFIKMCFWPNYLYFGIVINIAVIYDTLS
jgi:hypothetical protein